MSGYGALVHNDKHHGLCLFTLTIAQLSALWTKEFHNTKQTYEPSCSIPHIHCKTPAHPLQGITKTPLSSLVHPWVVGDDEVLQARGPVQPLCNGLGEALSVEVGALDARVRVVARVQRIGGDIAELEVHPGGGGEVVDLGDPRVGEGPLRRGDVAHEPGRAAAVLPALPQVIGRLGAEHHRGPLGEHELGGLDVVKHKGVDCLARLVRVAHLGPGAGAVGPPIVVLVGRAAVVVPKLNHHHVARPHQVRHLGEPPLVPIRARRPSADRLVHHRRGRVLLKVVAPAVRLPVVGAAARHGAVAAQVDGRQHLLREEQGAERACEEGRGELHCSFLTAGVLGSGEEDDLTEGLWDERRSRLLLARGATAAWLYT